MSEDTQEIKDLEEQIKEQESNSETNIITLGRLRKEVEIKLSIDKQQQRINKFEKDSKGNLALLNIYEKRNPHCNKFISQKNHFEKHLKLYFDMDKKDLSLKEIRALQFPMENSYKRALRVLVSEINPFVLQIQMFEMLDKFDKRLKKLERV